MINRSGGNASAVVMSLLEGHHRFLQTNTGDTHDRHADRYVINQQGVIANNRHFIGDTQMEYQPDGDGTSEGQVLLVLGYLHAYQGTLDTRYLEAAEYHWQAYVDYFYRGQVVPDSPMRWIANWLVNAKEPVLANYPIDPISPTHSGFKGVEFPFVDGLTIIPHGSPWFGQYLDVATFAFTGVLAWNAINASVKALNPDGSTDWDQDGVTYPVDWIISWTGKKIDSDGNVLSVDHPLSERGTVQLKDRTLTGTYKLNFSPRVPVELGGRLIDRNEPQHNRPLHVPLLGSINQMGNAADAEVWFADACYLLWDITGKPIYKRALDAVLVTIEEYTDIDSTDQFFRQTTDATTPWTDGISYEYTYPSNAPVTFSRDSEGYITATLESDASLSLEQKAIRFRINEQTKCSITVGGVGNDNSSLRFEAELAIGLNRQGGSSTVYRTKLPASNSLIPITYVIPLTEFYRSVALDGSPYLIADARSVTDYGGTVWSETHASGVLGSRSGSIISALFPNDDAGLIWGFWLLDSKNAPVQQITYRSDGEFDLRFEDAEGWRWYWILPDTQMEWLTVNLDPDDVYLSGYQPNRNDRVDPSAPAGVITDQVTFLLENGGDVNKTLEIFCLNELPELFTGSDGYTHVFTLTVRADAAYTAVVGDCTILDYRDDSLMYCPGVIPMSNIYQEGTSILGAWRGLPYPGYQYPGVFCLGDSVQGVRLNNVIDFLYDSQQWYLTQMGILGPGASAFVWDRWDNASYGEPNTFTMYHWGDSEAWSGYQPRAFSWACRTWQLLVERNYPVPIKLQQYCENWITWLVGFIDQHGPILPSTFPMTTPPTAIPGDFTGHMTGLWLSGSCLAALAGCKVAGLDRLIESCIAELCDNYVITPTPEHPMNGSWSPWAAPNSNDGMFYGFWAGEILKGLGLYLRYRRNVPIMEQS